MGGTDELLGNRDGFRCSGAGKVLETGEGQDGPRERLPPADRQLLA